MPRYSCKALLLLLACPPWAPAATYPAYNTYLHPPFVQQDGGGLAAELVEALNKHMGGDRFELVNVPRARFVAMATRKQGRIDGIALFLSPAFLKQPLSKRVAWSVPLFSDHNVMVFRNGQAAEMPGNLRSLRFGSVRGHEYQFINSMPRRGKMRVEEVGDEMTNLRKLVAGRIDFTLLNRLHFRALSQTAPGLEVLEAVPEPGGDFQRHVLISPDLPQPASQHVAAAVQSLQRDPEWQATLARFGVSSER